MLNSLFNDQTQRTSFRNDPAYNRGQFEGNGMQYQFSDQSHRNHIQSTRVLSNTDSYSFLGNSSDVYNTGASLADEYEGGPRIDQSINKDNKMGQFYSLIKKSFDDYFNTFSQNITSNLEENLYKQESGDNSKVIQEDVAHAFRQIFNKQLDLKFQTHGNEVRRQKESTERIEDLLNLFVNSLEEYTRVAKICMSNKPIHQRRTPGVLAAMISELKQENNALKKQLKGLLEPK
jgi:hypothetical protein